MTLKEELLEYLHENEISPEQFAAVDEFFDESALEEFIGIFVSEMDWAEFHERARNNYLRLRKVLAGDYSSLDIFPNRETLKAIAELEPDGNAELMAALSVPTIKVALIAKDLYQGLFEDVDKFQIELSTSWAVVFRLALLILEQVEGAIPDEEACVKIAVVYLQVTAIFEGKKEEIFELLRQEDEQVPPLAKVACAALEEGYRELAKREETKERNFDEDLPVLVFRVFSFVKKTHKKGPAKPWWKAVYRALYDHPATSHYAANENAFVRYIHEHLSKWQGAEKTVLETDVMTQKTWWEPKTTKKTKFSPLSRSEKGAYPGYVNYAWSSYISEAKKEKNVDALSQFGGEDRAKLMTHIARLITGWLTEGMPDPHTYKL